MRTVLLGVQTTLVVLLAMVGSMAAAPGLKLKAGFGYEYMSQKFFLDSLAYAGADSVDISTALNTTYLDDLKGYVGLNYTPYDDYRLELRSAYEQTPDEYRLRLNADYRPEFRALSLDLNSELDWRDGPVDEGEVDDGYLSGYGRARLTVATSSHLSIWGQVKSDFVRFDQPREAVYDYFRLDGQFGITRYFSDFSTFTASFYAGERGVTDDDAQDYYRWGGEAAFLGFHDRGEIDLLMTYESRDYNQVDGLGDYGWLEFDGHHRHDLSSQWFAREELNVEVINFNNNELYAADYSCWEGRLLLGRRQGALSVALGTDSEVLSEAELEDMLISQDYRELGLMAQLDLIQPGSIFGTLESVTGRRNVKDEGDAESGSYHTDFTYERLTLLLDWSSAAGLSLNLVLSTDWEWHENAEENSRLTLLTGGVYYSF